MRLPDFSTFAPLVVLRKAMGAEEDVALQAVSWAPLDRRGIDLDSIDEVLATGDGTLAYNGQTVLLYIRDQHVALAQNGAESSYRYHLANCATVAGMRGAGRGDRYVVTNRQDGLFVVRPTYNPEGEEFEVRLQVCRNCLKVVNWDDYRSVRERERQRIVSSFQLEDFFLVYEQVTPAHRRIVPQVSAARTAPARSVVTRPQPPKEPARPRAWGPPPTPAAPRAGTPPPPTPASQPAPLAATPTLAPPPPRPEPKPTASPPPPAPAPAAAPPWIAGVPATFHPIVLHLHKHGSLSEAEMTQLLQQQGVSVPNAQRHLRRFRGNHEEWLHGAPFRLRIEQEGGQSRFRVIR